MRIQDIKSGRAMDVSDSYGARLIEQGKAKLLPTRKESAKKAAPAKKVEA